MWISAECGEDVKSGAGKMELLEAWDPLFGSIYIVTYIPHSSNTDLGSENIANQTFERVSPIVQV